jgi:hypothetical protein
MLVVYLNIPSGGIKQAETEATIAEIKARHASAFFAIHVLWSRQAFLSQRAHLVILPHHRLVARGRCCRSPGHRAVA